MGRSIRNTALLVKNETVYGTDITPTGAANAILGANITIEPLKAKNVARDLMRPFFGASEQLVGVASVGITVDVELAGSGTAGTAAAWGPLLRACAFAETISAGQRVEYLPISESIESVTIYYYDDGVLHKILGARGDPSIKLNVEEKPMLSFKFEGLDGVVSAGALPSVTLTGWKTPLIVTDANTGDFTFGGTYATGAITGGLPYRGRSLELTIGNQLDFTALLGGESVDITDRNVGGKIALDLTAAQEVAFYSDVKANLLSSLGIVHGTTAGNKVLLHMPGVQKINYRKEAIGKRRLIGYDLVVPPTTAGNDELRIVTF